MMTMNQLRETLNRIAPRAPHLGDKAVIVVYEGDKANSLESCEIDYGHVRLTAGNPEEAGDAVRKSDSEEVPEAEDDLLADDGQ